MKRGGRPKATEKLQSERVCLDVQMPLTEQLRSYLHHLEVRHYSQNTLAGFRRDIERFFDWCRVRDLMHAGAIDKPCLVQYQRWLFRLRRPDGKPLSARTQKCRMSSLKGFFSWLTKEDHIPANPAADIELPKVIHSLPKDVLTIEEVERTFAIPDVNTVMGLRERTILEVLYSTGIRRKEAVELEVFDVDHTRRCLYISRGKGGKARIIPVGERALRWIDRYLEQARPTLLLHLDERALFLTTMGEPITVAWLGSLVKRCLHKAGVQKPGACHLFRHTMATRMLENGADIRFVQAMLGHADISTTQIYTHVAVEKLRQVHAATHPGEALHDDLS